MEFLLSEKSLLFGFGEYEILITHGNLFSLVIFYLCLEWGFTVL